MTDRRQSLATARLHRRDVLAGTALGVGSALGLTACAGAGGRTSSPAPRGPGAGEAEAPGFHLFSQPDLDFEAAFALGAAAYGAAEAGEVLATVDRINAAGASYQTFVDGFRALARRVASRADAAARAGHPVSARAASLRAAQYHKQALYFVLGTSRPGDEEAVYRAMQREWDRAAGAFRPPLERVAIPYEGTTLPGYFLRPDASGARRRTIILNNGSDGQNVDLWTYGGAAALERGYNALIFEGPGQGAMLFERQVPFRPDWERVVTPVVDFLVGRPDVDPRRIGIIGWSMCGALVARAAAFEPRLGAVCLDPGLADIWTSWPEPLRQIAAAGGREEVNQLWRRRILTGMTPVQQFTLMKRIEIFGKPFQDRAREGRVTEDFHAVAQAIARFRYADDLPRITAPVLVTRYEQERLGPPQAAQETYDRLRSPRTLVTFSAEDGAGLHDAPLAPRRRNEVIFDWFDDTLGR